MPLTLLAAALAQAGACRAAGLREGELCYGTACLQGETLAKGPGTSALQGPSASTRCPPGSTVGWSEKRARGGGFQKDPSARCSVHGSKGSRAHQQPHPLGTCSAGTDQLKFIRFFPLFI